MLIYKGHVEYVINVENLKHLLTNMCGDRLTTIRSISKFNRRQSANSQRLKEVLLGRAESGNTPRKGKCHILTHLGFMSNYLVQRLKGTAGYFPMRISLPRQQWISITDHDFCQRNYVGFIPLAYSIRTVYINGLISFHCSARPRLRFPTIDTVHLRLWPVHALIRILRPHARLRHPTKMVGQFGRVLRLACSLRDL